MSISKSLCLGWSKLEFQNFIESYRVKWKKKIFNCPAKIKTTQEHKNSESHIKTIHFIEIYKKQIDKDIEEIHQAIFLNTE